MTVLDPRRSGARLSFGRRRLARVIAAHRRPDSSEDAPECLDQSIEYIQDFDRQHTDRLSIRDFIHEMTALHCEPMNLATLYQVTYLLSGRAPRTRLRGIGARRRPRTSGGQ